MRTATTAVAVVLSLVVSQTALGAVDARLQGTFAMTGKITFADHVYGEHEGQDVLRSWEFAPRCGAGVCREVTLSRTRSGQGIVDAVLLKRRAPGVYMGQGRFWVALECDGVVVAHGGLATERITVRITRRQTVGTTRFATAVSATYVNPRRVNLTRCPGGIGHDAARYTGWLSSPLPGPPTATSGSPVDTSTEQDPNTV